jgi:hypothetical protein
VVVVGEAPTGRSATASWSGIGLLRSGIFSSLLVGGRIGECVVLCVVVFVVVVMVAFGSGKGRDGAADLCAVFLDLR